MKISRLCRYAVKGLGPDDLGHVAVQAGRAFPDDRRFALSSGAGALTQTGWQQKGSFLTLLKHEKLAALETHYDAATTTLTISRMGKQICSGRLTDPLGRAMIEDFFSAYMGRSVPAKPHVVEAIPGTALTDTETQFVSLINLASVRDLERILGTSVDPIRFRGNIYFDSDQPWSEFGWIGQEIAVGLVRLKVVERTGRCAATSVDPATGIRDRNIPKTLHQGFGHSDMGIYAVVMSDGEITVGDSLIP